MWKVGHVEPFLALVSSKDLKQRLEDAYSALSAIEPSDFGDREMRDSFVDIFQRFFSNQEREGHYVEDTLASMSMVDADALSEDVVEFCFSFTEKVARLNR
jgi:hypothetical protein